MRPTIAITGITTDFGAEHRAGLRTAIRALLEDGALIRTGTSNGVEMFVAQTVYELRPQALELYQTNPPRDVPMEITAPSADQERLHAILRADRSLPEWMLEKSAHHPHLLLGSDLRTPANALFVISPQRDGTVSDRKTLLGYELARRLGISTENGFSDPNKLASIAAKYATRGYPHAPDIARLELGERFDAVMLGRENRTPQVFAQSIDSVRGSDTSVLYVGPWDRATVRAMAPNAELLGTRQGDAALLPFAQTLASGESLRVVGHVSTPGEIGPEHRVADRIASLASRLNNGQAVLTNFEHLRGTIERPALESPRAELRERVAEKARTENRDLRFIEDPRPHEGNVIDRLGKWAAIELPRESPDQQQLVQILNVGDQNLEIGQEFEPSMDLADLGREA